jgi:transposase
MGKVKKATGPGTHLSPFISDLLGLSGYLLIENKCGQQNDVWVIAVTPRYICLVCERCASNDVSLHGTFQHDVVHVPLGTKRTQLRIFVPRIFCHHCRHTTSPPLLRIVAHRQISVDLRQFFLDRYQSRQTYAQIAFDSGSTERSVARIIKEEVKRVDQARNDALSLAGAIGVDDIRMFPGEDGIWTHIVDVEAAETIDLLPGESGELVQFFLGSLKDVGAVSSYSSDGAAQYISVGKANFPEAVRTLNPFHVIKYLFEGLDGVRSEALSRLDSRQPTQGCLIDYVDEKSGGSE